VHPFWGALFLFALESKINSKTGACAPALECMWVQ
jgi:hypothetical protein